MAIFAPAERLPTSATLAWAKMAILGQNGTLWGVVNLVKMKGYKIRRSVLILGVELKLHTDFANNSRIERKKGPTIASSQKSPQNFFFWKPVPESIHQNGSLDKSQHIGTFFT